MSINMELMKKKLATLRGDGDTENSVWFKPQEGETVIRIVPSADGDPLKEMHFHYNVGEHRGGVLCPKRNLVSAAQFAILHPPFGRMESATTMRKVRSLQSHYLYAGVISLLSLFADKNKKG